MYWDALGALLSRYPYVRGDVEKLDSYLTKMEFKKGDRIDVVNLSMVAHIPLRNAKSIIEKSAELGIFEKNYRLKCSVKDNPIYIQNTPFGLPAMLFCDLCGTIHEFYEKDVDIIYTMNFIYSKKDLDVLSNKMPVIGYFADKYSHDPKYEAQFSGKICIFILHFLKDILIFLESCEKLGLKSHSSYVFYKPYLYPHADYIISHLKTNGYNVYPLEDLRTVLSKLAKDSSESILVFEDGGYIVPLVHKEFEGLLPRIIGVVEQTTRGIKNDRLINELKLPVLSVAESDIKNKIEPPYVADAVMKNIENLLKDEKFRGNNAAIIGYGAIGEAIAERFNKIGMNITIYDPSPEKRVYARDKGLTIVEESYNAVKNKLLVIGCSGETSISRKEISNLDHKSFLVSASSDQKEIGLIELKSMSQKSSELVVDGKKIGTSFMLRGQKEKTINLLADGFPINFWYSESMPNQVSDLILSYIFLCGLELCCDRDRFENSINQVNAIANSHNLMNVYDDSNR